ncbi:MAG: TerB family tellurite resistance protein [Acetobacteraceae bacterium]|nr:TerB family tellurite resistance protein [Acetobacteraceae bacterium]
MFDAVVTAGAMMACADRPAAASERSEFATFVGHSPWMPTFTASDAAEAFDSRVRQFEMVGGDLDREMGSLRQVSDDIGIGEVVRVCELVAMADGRLQPAEVQVLRDVRSAMGRPLIGD